MLSAVITTAHGYPALTVGTITGTPEVRPSRSSRRLISPYFYGIRLYLHPIFGGGQRIMIVIDLAYLAINNHLVQMDSVVTGEEVLVI